MVISLYSALSRGNRMLGGRSAARGPRARRYNNNKNYFPSRQYRDRGARLSAGAASVSRTRNRAPCLFCRFVVSPAINIAVPGDEPDRAIRHSSPPAILSAIAEIKSGRKKIRSHRSIQSRRCPCTNQSCD